MIKQERFYQLFNSLPQTEKDNIVRTAIELSVQFQNSSVSDLMRACHYHATEAMRTFRLKKQRIHHATRYAALRYAMMSHLSRTLHAA